jgi:hypothetical protein
VTDSSGWDTYNARFPPQSREARCALCADVPARWLSMYGVLCWRCQRDYHAHRDNIPRELRDDD